MKKFNLNDKGVKDRIFHATDVQVKDLKGKVFQHTDYPHNLTWYSPRYYFQDNV